MILDVGRRRVYRLNFEIFVERIFVGLDIVHHHRFIPLSTLREKPTTTAKYIIVFLRHSSHEVTSTYSPKDSLDNFETFDLCDSHLLMCGWARGYVMGNTGISLLKFCQETSWREVSVIINFHPQTLRERRETEELEVLEKEKGT